MAPGPPGPKWGGDFKLEPRGSRDAGPGGKNRGWRKVGGGTKPGGKETNRRARNAHPGVREPDGEQRHLVGPKGREKGIPSQGFF